MPMPKTEVDFNALDALLQFKVTLSFCADYLNVSVDAIQRRIRENFDMSFTEYHNLKMEGTAVKLQQKVMKNIITDPNRSPALTIFALKNMAKWTDKQEVMQTVEHDHVFNIVEWNDNLQPETEGNQGD